MRQFIKWQIFGCPQFLSLYLSLRSVDFLKRAHDHVMYTFDLEYKFLINSPKKFDILFRKEIHGSSVRPLSTIIIIVISIGSE